MTLLKNPSIPYLGMFRTEDIFALITKAEDWLQ